MWPVLIPAAAAVVAAATSGYGVYKSSKQAAVNNRFNRDEAEKNRQFQAGERETSMQDAVRDYKLAGINPIHSAKMGGAAQPSGAQAQASNIDAGGNAINAGNALLHQALTASQVELNRAQADNLRATTETTNASRIPLVDKIKQEVYNLDLDWQARSQLYKQMEELNPIALKQAQKALEQLDLANKHSKYDIQRALNEEDMEKFFEGPAGNWLRLLRGFFNAPAAR